MSEQSVWNPGSYQSTKKAILDGGGSEWLAEEAAMIVASDDPAQPGLGRTEADQRLIALSTPYVLAAAALYQNQGR